MRKMPKEKFGRSFDERPPELDIDSSHFVETDAGNLQRWEVDSEQALTG